ncbi:clostripain family protein [gut metagenome]|uniref:Clostripain family protein n=1 Tax=gut metagenome TaxID=749906 RepID=J9C1N4_9ZZZZ
MKLRQILYQWGTGIFFCLSTLTACSDDDAPVEEPVLPQPPTVAISKENLSFTTANLQLQSANVLQCAYLVLEGNAEDPDLKEVLKKGTQVAANKTVDILLEDLDANTAYKVFAVARGEDDYVWASTQFTTETIPLPEKRHTQIFYYMGDDTGMENELEANLRVIQGAAGHLIRLSEKNQVAIFYDNGKTSTLTQLVVNNKTGRTEHKVIEQYTQESLSTDPAFMKAVLKKITTLMPADSYGLILSSHGGGWVPSNLFDQHTASTRFIGQDGSKFMEIPQLAEALDGIKMRYILFDACLMSSVEALYTLRKTADYFIASPTEVLASGFPYKEIVPMLFQDNLKGACEAFINKYRLSSGTIALVQSDKLDALAAAMKDVRTAAGNNKQVDCNAIQGYEGLKPHLFYDLEQYAEALTSDVGAFKTALKETVIYEAHTSSFITGYQKDPVRLPKSCGLSCFIDSGKFPETQKAWLATDWAKAIGASK